MIWAAIIFGGLSAVAWFGAAVISPAVVHTGWGGVPSEETGRRLRIGAALNAVGALFAALAMACQAYATWAGML
jgi:hypothetical protein